MTEPPTPDDAKGVRIPAEHVIMSETYHAWVPAYIEVPGIAELLASSTITPSSRLEADEPVIVERKEKT